MDGSVSLCPLCKSNLNPGATACGSCGATEIDGWDAMGASKRMPYMLLALGILFGPITFLFSQTYGLLIMAVCFGGFLLIRSSQKKKRVWVTSAGRKQVY